MIIVFLPVQFGLPLSHKSAEERRPKETIIQMSSIFRWMDSTHNRDKDFGRKWEDDAREEKPKGRLGDENEGRSEGSCVWHSEEPSAFAQFIDQEEQPWPLDTLFIDLPRCRLH